MRSFPFRPAIRLLALGWLTLSCSSTPDNSAKSDANDSSTTTGLGGSTASASSGEAVGGTTPTSATGSTGSRVATTGSASATATATSTGGAGDSGGWTVGTGAGGASADGTLTGTNSTAGFPTGGGAGGSATTGSVTSVGTTGGTTGAGGGTSSDPVMSDGCGRTPTITTGNGKQIDVGGTTRTYNIRIPDDYDSNRPYRLIVGYHGASLSADIVTNEDYYGLWSLSEGSTIFVAPQGLPTGGPFGDGWANANGADVEFSRQLIAQLQTELCIDESRVFAEGFSMGGSMAYAMACGAPDIIRAVAVHSGGPMSGCVNHDTPVAYFMTHGTQDSICTYPGYGVPQLQDFAQVNGCATPNPASGAAEFEAALPDPTNSGSACVEFEGCREGYPVRSCLFVGDHMWNPGGRSSWVPSEVWDFFARF